MAFVSGLVLFCLYCLASDVVELEPVQSNDYYCSNFTGAGPCNLNPYCFWSDSSTCIDDPCLATKDSTITTCTNPIVGGVTVPCSIETAVTTHDCASAGNTKFCRATASTTPTYDYCFWAQVRDSACPSSICKAVDKRCVLYNSTGSSISQCQFLSTEADCKLVPKCLWKSSCMQDPCFDGSKGQPCGSYKVGTSFDGSPLASGDCVLYQPYEKGGEGTVVSYCVYKDNKSPNLCYFLGENSTSATDWNVAYPTYRGSSTDPQCTGTITGCDTNPSNACSTKINVKGALAGAYCGDAAHGAANILHIPSLVVFLFVTIFISMLTS